MVAYTQKLGAWGEELAAQFLVKKGYTLLDHHITARVGEIDLLCTQGDSLVFVEVKTRRSNTFGYGEESVSWRKLQKLHRAIERYLQHHPTTLFPRLDVVVVEFEGLEPTFLHYENVEM